MEIAALIISILALLAAAAAAFYSRRQALGTEAQTQEAKRANDRLDAIDAANAEAARVEAERNRVKWHLKPLSGNQWALYNEGRESARNVTLTLERAVLLISGSNRQGVQTIDEIRPHRPVTLTITPTPSWGDAGAPELRIECAGQDEPLVIPLAGS